MIDTREAINLRLIELLGDVDGIKGVFRDRADLPPNEKTPGILYLDGGEKIKTDLTGGNFTSMPVAVFTMRPQIFVVLTLRTDSDNTKLPDGTTLPVGPELSSFRAKIISAITNDDTLAALVSDNGSVVYEGFDSDMRSGDTIGSDGAKMQLHFAISYVLDPSDLV